MARVFFCLVLTGLGIAFAPNPVNAETGGYPYAGYNGPGSDASQGTWTDSKGQWYSNRYRFAYRNCTDFVAWKLDETNEWYIGTSMGHARDWKEWALSKGYGVDSAPAPGSVAWWAGSQANGFYGHVAWVESVSGNDITIQEYNNPFGSGAFNVRTISKDDPSGYIHFKDLDGAPSSSNNTTLALKKLTQSDGANVVYWAKGTDVFETWWRPGGDGLHHSSIIHIEQGDIVDIDAQIHADGLHQVYTATKRFVWETWWYPGQPLHWSAIVQSPHEIKAIQKTVDASGTHQLYAMTSAGVDEYWWRIGGDGVHGSRIFSLNDPVSIKKHFEPDGRQVIYVADRAYVYEVWWRPGVPGITIGTIIHIAQADIVDIDLSTHQGNLHRLYTGTANSGVWEAKWTPGLAGISYRRITGGTGVVAIQKWMDGETHNLYVATNGGVFEYWWLSAETNTHASIILNNIADVRDFERTTSSDGAQAVYTIANTRVYESWWVPGGNGIRSKPIA